MSYSLRNILIASVLALVVVLLTVSYIQTQKSNIQHNEKNVTVLVAKKDIPQGTSADKLQTGGFLVAQKIVKRDATAGAMTNADQIREMNATTAIYAGQQLSSRMFARGVSANTMSSDLRGNERAMMVPMGNWQGMTDYLKTGDHVDIFASRVDDTGNATTPITWVVARDVPVLKAPAKQADDKATAQTASVMLKVTDKTAEDLIWAQAHADDNKLVFALRPQSGDQNTKLPQPLATSPDIN